jgi:hypothetical protein
LTIAKNIQVEKSVIENILLILKSI